MSHCLSPALQEVSHKWRALAERRRAYLVDLYRSGRWTRYYSEEQFLHCLQSAIRASERWTEIAPAAPQAEANPEIGFQSSPA
jgi:uncharacterized repeat protein (TIGR03809 family)